MAKPEEEIVETDLLVAGGGLAGCWAAIAASDLGAKVTLVDKGAVARSGDAVFCHDLLAPTPEKELDTWLKEMVEHAEYMMDQDFAWVLLSEEGDRIRKMQDFGVPFERDEAGQLFLSVGRGHISSKTVLCDCRKMMEVMRKEVCRRPINLVERVMVTDLLTSDGVLPTQGRVVGALGIHGRTGKLSIFKAKAVFLSTGVVGFKLHTQYADNLTGDAQAMAFRAGAELAGLEFGFSPRFVGLHKGRVYTQSLMPFQTQGAHLVNSQGYRYMESYAPKKMERLSTCGLLALASVNELLEGRGPVYFDMRHFSPEHHEQLRRILPLRMAPLDAINLDPGKELIECAPLVCYLGGGGIKINVHGESSLPGLLAGGIASHAGAGEWVSGAMLGVCNVFGYRAGIRAAALAKELGEVKINRDQVQRLKSLTLAPGKKETGVGPMEIFRRLGSKMVKPEYTIVKSERKIKEMLAEIRAIAAQDLPRLSAQDAHGLIKANEARNFVDFLEPLFIASLERRESRLTHYRLEYPYRDDGQWLKWVVVKKKDSTPVVSYEPTIKADSSVKPAESKRIPSPIKVFPERVN